MSQYRYPGAQPFEAHQRDIFFGREHDIKRLYDYVMIEKLVVLYSKSGLGKSSLMNAGVMPRLEASDKWLPLSFRFGAWVQGRKQTPLETTKIVLSQDAGNSTLLDKIIPKENSLWYLLKTRQLCSPNGKGFVLFFDQFEELFTWNESDIHAFKLELSDLLNTTVPGNFRSETEKRFRKNPGFLTDDELEKLNTPLHLRIVLAIRSDRMSLLDKLSSHLPTILTNCYELGPLDRPHAEEAIWNPAYKKGDFLSPNFDYDDQALDNILDYLTKDNTQSIESFQLQIVCQSIERKVIDKQLKVVTAADVGKVEDIIENYYDDQINLLDSEAEKLAARRLIEEGLVLEEEQRRLSLYEGQIERDYGVSKELLLKLVNTHMLRAEPSLQGGYTYELCHDTIVSPILKAKAKRLEEERKRQMARERLAERERLEQERKATNRKFRAALLTASLVVVAALVSLFFMWKNRQTIQELRSQEAQTALEKELREKADSLRLETEKTLKELQQAQTILAAQLDTIREQKEKLDSTLVFLYNSGLFLDENNQQLKPEEILERLTASAADKERKKQQQQDRLNSVLQALFDAGSGPRVEKSRDAARDNLLKLLRAEPDLLDDFLAYVTQRLDVRYQYSVWQSVYVLQQLDSGWLNNYYNEVCQFENALKHSGLAGTRTREQLNDINRKMRTPCTTF